MPEIQDSVPPTRTTRLLELLSRQRSVVAISAAMFLMSFGEDLWKRFVPKYLEALGAPITVIGLYGSARDILDGVYQYPGGWVGDHLGRRRALMLFVGLASVGYAVYAFAPSWPFVFVGLALGTAWNAMANPVLFAVIGDSLPRGRRAAGFIAQSILRRVPVIVAPAIGGLLIATGGIDRGVRTGLGISIVLALTTLAIVGRIDVAAPPRPEQAAERFFDVWRTLPTAFRRLLMSDIFIRACEGMVDVFLVLYATNVVGVSATQFGVLVGVQMVTAILAYFPAAALAGRVGQKPLVVATFVAFSLFPLAVALSGSFPALVLAFVIGGLREIGEPARKAFIVDLAVPHLRARAVGVYYFVRSAAISPAAIIGGMLWQQSPSSPFYAASAIGLLGTVVFVLTVHERDAV